jgi:hypothetical protein
MVVLSFTTDNKGITSTVLKPKGFPDPRGRHPQNLNTFADGDNLR